MDPSNEHSLSSETDKDPVGSAGAHWFPASYEISRARFRSCLGAIRQSWPGASLESFHLDADEDLTIDRVEAPALQRKEKLLVLTTGEHGIEAYVGAAMLELFVAEYLGELDPDDTGLLLVHAINPWGMRHHRRVNASNVDLNRNFLLPEAERPENLGYARPENPGYARIKNFLNPERRLSSWLNVNLGFLSGVLSALTKLGFKGALGSILLGQYHYPDGLYFGGDRIQPETQHLIKLYQQWFSAYGQIVLLDMHTGYGPRYTMSLVNSFLESRSSSEFAQRFGYTPVVSTTPDEFYAIQGDMIDFIYALRASQFPEKPLYATSFEFGTYGDGIFDHLRELRTMILENQGFHYGANSQALWQRVRQDFEALYFPQAADWQSIALQDARRAISGILKAEGYIG